MTRRTKPLRWFGAGAAVASLAVAGLAVATPQATANSWDRCLEGSADTQAVFDRAAEVSGVPVDVLLAVGYLESRWSHHDGAASTSGGYGVMHLTDQQVTAVNSEAKGDRPRGLPDRAGTLPLAAELTGIDADQLRQDHVANICGGAAVLASYQPSTSSQSVEDWSKAVALYAGTASEDEGRQFAEMVFDVLRSGATETTDTGDTVTLAAHQDADVDAAAVQSAGLLEPGIDEAECPRTLECEVIESPYRKTGPDPTQYVNYDLANRPHDLSIDYIVVHNTECEYDTCIGLLQGPRFVSWNYTLRSSDGHVAQHVANRNIAAHAGNWYINMHSIGFEHEGFAAEGGSWYTESMYRSSALLARHLAKKYDIELDRSHVVGHDQYHAIARWDPGPYWDWEHYMSLLGNPIKGHGNKHKPEKVTVKPGFDDNQNLMTGCTTAGVPCPAFGSNFVYLYSAPSEDAPLVNGGTRVVSDKNPRAAAGHEFVVADRQGDWLKVWWDGTEAWLHSPADDPTVVPSRGEYVTPAGDTPVTVYARAYPEESAYAGTQVPYQGQPTLDAITIKPGQKFVIGDKQVPTDYYYAKSFDDSIPDDHTVIRGEERYYQIFVGHRFGYVKAADVVVGR